MAILPILPILSIATNAMDSFVTITYAMLVGIGLVYLLMVILFRSLLVPVLIFFALPLVVIGGFVSLAVTGHALDLSALVGLLMLRGIVVTNALVLRDLAVATNAIMLLDLTQHRVEAGDDVRTVLIQGSRTRVRSILMTATATILAVVIPSRGPPTVLSWCLAAAHAAPLGALGRLLAEPAPAHAPAALSAHPLPTDYVPACCGRPRA